MSGQRVHHYTHPDLHQIELLTVLRALADPVRLGILQHLAELGEANCTTLLNNRPKSSMSHHFQVLRESGLLHTEIDGIQHRNRIRRKELDQRFPGLMDAVLGQKQHPVLPEGGPSRAATQ